MKPKIYYWSLWFLRFFLAIAVVAAVARPAFAQATVITPQTANQTIFSGQTTTAEVQIKDFGQNVHFLTYFSSTANCMMNIRFQASYDNSAFFPISEDGADARQFPQAVGGGGSFPGLVAYGWFPIIQVLLEIPSNVAGNNCHVTAYYSGTSTADSTIQQGFIQSNGFRKLIALGEPPLSVVTQAPATYGSTGGRLYVLCGTACGTAQILITPVSIPAASAANAPSDTGPVLQTINLANVNTIQTFDITAVPAESVFVSMDATPGSADWVTIYYQFLPETNIGNTVNVNCLSGCGGGGGGANIVWGPDAIGVAPTEPPVQVGGLNPSGNVAEIQTDLLGNQIVVGPTAIGTTDTTTQPLQIGGPSDTVPNAGIIKVTANQGLNDIVALDVNVANTTSDASTGAQTTFTTTPLIVQPATANFSISGSILDYANVGIAPNIVVRVTGTWTGSISASTSPTNSTGLQASLLYPVLNGTTDFGAGFLSPITANGNYLIPNGGSIALVELVSGVATGSATVTISGMNPASSVYVVQPTASNLNATVVQPTAANLNAQVVGAQAAGVAPSVKPVYVAPAIDVTSGVLEPLFVDAAGIDAQRVEPVRQTPQTTATYSVSSGTGCFPLSPTPFPWASAVAINVSGTWTGSIAFQASLLGSTGTYGIVDLYPTLTGSGGDGIITGPYVSAITANGNWLVFPSGMSALQACGTGITGAAIVFESSSNYSNSAYAIQPVAANLHARTEPNAAPSSACTPVVINFSSSGNNTVVAGVASQKVRIYSLSVVFGGAATVTFEDGASTPLTGPMGIFSGGSINAANEGAPQFITSSGNGFIINLSAGVQASGWGCYSQF